MFESPGGQGFIDGSTGLSRDSNPYPPDSDEFDEWDEGWLAGREV